MDQNKELDCQETHLSRLLLARTCPGPDECARQICSPDLDEDQLVQLGTFSAAIYDTAWASMIKSPAHNTRTWLFPSAFDYILQSQGTDGTWPQYASPVDGILNTLSGLLSMIAHRDALETNSLEISFLEHRIASGCEGLQSLLSSWNVDETDHVAFEIIVPALLNKVEKFRPSFDFDGRRQLMDLYALKMRHFTPEVLYSDHKSTMLHSLEAFDGFIEFDKVSHHCTELLGMCGSPASTAAYLMNSSSWDSRAEAYLSRIFAQQSVDGSVPNAFPTCVFELSWACSTLWSPHMTILGLSEVSTDQVASFLERALDSQNGIIGFAPGIVEDADDTARTILTLRRFGRQTDTAPMVECFQSGKYFRTFATERNPSFSANCNVLLAMLESGDVARFRSQIEYAVDYILELWDAGPIKDKWNLSSEYSHMLLAETLISVLKRYDAGEMSIASETVLYRIPIAICQTLTHSIKHQEASGGWKNDVEVTAYNLLIIVQCLSLPLPMETQNLLQKCLSQGRAFIASNYGDPTKHRPNWIEKTTYQPRLLKVVYCSLALHAIPIQHPWTETLTSCFSLPAARFQKLRKLLLALPRFREQGIFCIEIMLLEAAMYSRRLQVAKQNVVPRNQIPMTEDKYLDFIPTIWQACNSVAGEGLRPYVLWEMIKISLLNFQIDEYMESVIAFVDTASLEHLLSVVNMKCDLSTRGYGRKSPSSMSKGNHSVNSNANGDSANSHDDRHDSGGDGDHEISSHSSTEVVDPIVRYIDYILEHPAVRRSSSLTQSLVASELKDFIIAHIDHNGARDRKSKNHNGDRRRARSGYFAWVTSTASNDTSCPLSFQFFCCLLSRPGTSAFPSVEAQYVSQSLARHLATMCRQYNDYGSARRDKEEGNLNSLDFPEFDVDRPAANGDRKQVDVSHSEHSPVVAKSVANGAVSRATMSWSHESQKASLMDIAEFERQLTLQCLQTLKQRQLASQRIIRAIEVFIDVTDVFGQVYVQKDIASRVVREQPDKKGDQ